MRTPAIVIGGIAGTVAEHVELMREQGQPERCIDYFIGRALDRAWSGETTWPAAVSVADYRASQNREEA